MNNTGLHGSENLGEKDKRVASKFLGYDKKEIRVTEKGHQME